jgi:hypothetical protein
MDLHMLMLFGAKERTAREFQDLLAGARFKVRNVAVTGSPAGLGVIEATRSLDSSLPRTVAKPPDHDAIFHRVAGSRPTDLVGGRGVRDESHVSRARQSSCPGS